jgi:hypothetical protein
MRRRQAGVGAMISKEQARRQVQSELQSLKLQKPMSDWDVSIFAVQMARKLPFSSAGSSRYKAICGWVHEWQRGTFLEPPT